MYRAGLRHRITSYLEKNHLICSEQNEFRAERSCLDHIYSLYNASKIRLNQNLQTFLTFIEFSKAFDYVETEFLLHKLLNIGIEGKVYNLVKSIYSNPLSCVQLNGHLGGWFPVESGVRQGDSLSPILFAVFINDLAALMNQLDAGVWIGEDKLSLLMYADDIVLLSENPEQTQSQLDVMTQCCSQWVMAINAKKSQIVHTRHHQHKRETTKLYCCGQELMYVDSYKYLGYYIYDHLKDQKTVNILTGSAERAFGKIKDMF